MTATTAIRFLSAFFCSLWALAAGAQVSVSSADQFAEVGMIDVARVVPDVLLEMRYASSRNFVGAPIDGYEAPRCYLNVSAVEALGRVARKLSERGLRLKVFDCYRPVRAVQHFMRWAADLEDQRTKAEYFPSLAKPELVGDYIAPVSGHSRGATLDLTLARCDSNAQCVELDMGTPFDFFDTRANTDSPRITSEQRANRDVLLQAMRSEGFANYAAEWWHYTFQPEPSTRVAYDIPINDWVDTLRGRDPQQLVLVVTPDWNSKQATLRTYDRESGRWVMRNSGVPVVIGANGSAWGLGLHEPQVGLQKREGDGRSPAGAFAIGQAFGYAPSAATGLNYVPMSESHYCIDDSASSFYNRIVDVRRVGQQLAQHSTEPMRRDLHLGGDRQYELGFVIDHNPALIPEKGSCIFAHVWKAPDHGTAGCIALAAPALRELLAWLRADARGVLVLLPSAELQRVQKSWDLPN